MTNQAETVVDNPPVRPDVHVGEMRVLDKTGDLKIVWSSDKPDELAQARRTFDEMIAKGYSAFSVKKSGEPGKPLHEFDPEIEAMILVPRIVGG